MGATLDSLHTGIIILIHYTNLFDYFTTEIYIFFIYVSQNYIDSFKFSSQITTSTKLITNMTDFGTLEPIFAASGLHFTFLGLIL